MKHPHLNVITYRREQNKYVVHLLKPEPFWSIAVLEFISFRISCAGQGSKCPLRSVDPEAPLHPRKWDFLREKNSEKENSPRHLTAHLRASQMHRRCIRCSEIKSFSKYQNRALPLTAPRLRGNVPAKTDESPTDGSVGFILENAGTCFPFSSATKRWRSPKGIPADVCTHTSVAGKLDEPAGSSQCSQRNGVTIPEG